MLKVWGWTLTLWEMVNKDFIKMEEMEEKKLKDVFYYMTISKVNSKINELRNPKNNFMNK